MLTGNAMRGGHILGTVQRLPLAPLPTPAANRTSAGHVWGKRAPPLHRRLEVKAEHGSPANEIHLDPSTRNVPVRQWCCSGGPSQPFFVDTKQEE